MVKTKRKRVTKPTIQIDYRQLEELCKIQCTRKEVSDVLGVSHDTLNRRCKEHYGKTFEEVQKKFMGFGAASLRRIQFTLASKYPSMAIWLGKQYLGQTDSPEAQDQDWAENIELLDDKTENIMQDRIGKYLSSGSTN